MNYSFIIIPILAAVIAQIIKLTIDSFNHKFSWQDLNTYGGMPSSHAAAVTALAAICGYLEGWDSAVFAIALIFALLTIRDAGGFRMILGQHASELNQIIHSLKPGESFKYDHLKERIGHTPLQLFFGIIIGLVVTVTYILLFL